MAKDLKHRMESVDAENRTLRRKSSVDISNFPKEILRSGRRRSSVKDEGFTGNNSPETRINSHSEHPNETVIIKSKIKKERKEKETLRRVITIKEDKPTEKNINKEILKVNKERKLKSKTLGRFILSLQGWSRGKVASHSLV